MFNSWICRFVFFLASIGILGPSTVLGRYNEKFATANEKFALKIFKAMKENKTAIISPYGLESVLDMMIHGSQGETRRELESVLGFTSSGLTMKQTDSIYRQLSNGLSTSGDSHVLKSVNLIALKEGTKLRTSYTKYLQRIHQASLIRVDFSSHKTVDLINEWAHSKTNGKIKKMINELDPLTIMVSLNALYFKGKWKYPFDPKSTRDELFYSIGKKPKKVPMMHVNVTLNYTSFSGVQAIELPYKGDEISMVVYLPSKRQPFHRFSQAVTAQKLSDIRKRMVQTHVILTLPKFKVEYYRDFSPDLKSLGAKTIFSQKADLGRMVENEGVFVSQIFQKAMVELNEEGTEAAAVTSVEVQMKAFRPKKREFRVDRPFMFTIVDKRNGLILFLGQVVDL